jgi:hypothetical protein
MLILHGVRHLQLPQPNGKFVQLNGTIGQMAKKPSKKDVNIKRELFCHASQKK